MAKSTYNKLMSEINKLQTQANSVRKQEVKNVIANIQQQMRDFNLTAKDLGAAASGGGTGTGKRRGRPPKNAAAEQGTQAKAKRSIKKATPKFRDPQSGVTWSGRGRMPKWISSAISQGRSKEDFAISQ